MKVILFQPRFAKLVENGSKRQTIRPKRKRPIHPGDTLSLRRWESRPYRSKQLTIGTKSCLEIHDFEIIPRSSNDGMFVSCFLDGRKIEAAIGNFGEWDQLARADGFLDAGEMVQWFKNAHGLPFYGTLIKW